MAQLMQRHGPAFTVPELLRLVWPIRTGGFGAGEFSLPEVAVRSVRPEGAVLGAWRSRNSVSGGLNYRFVVSSRFV
jgi:hypothetical protein